MIDDDSSGFKTSNNQLPRVFYENLQLGKGFLEINLRCLDFFLVGKPPMWGTPNGRLATTVL